MLRNNTKLLEKLVRKKVGTCYERKNCLQLKTIQCEIENLKHEVTIRDYTSTACANCSYWIKCKHKILPVFLSTEMLKKFASH